jgi:dTMP kinase
MSQGFFLTFEGPDGSGKSTQLRLLAQALQQQGRPIFTVRQPGGTALGERIRGLLLGPKIDEKTDDKTSSIAPLAEMALMFADRAQSIHETIAPALAAGKIVLCDRFTDSTEAYQGGGRGLGSAPVLELHRILCGNLQPDLTILLLPDLEASLARARRRNTRQQHTGQDGDRFEQEDRAFHQRVYAKYREIAARDTARVLPIEGTLPIDVTHDRILHAVTQRLHALGLFLTGP